MKQKRTSEENDELEEWLRDKPDLPIPPAPSKTVVWCFDCRKWVDRKDARECEKCHTFHCTKHGLSTCSKCGAEFEPSEEKK